MIVIKSQGIELEGGIDKVYLDAIRFRFDNNKLKINNDGSVYVPFKYFNNIEICYWSESLEELLNFVKFIFTKTDFAQNSTCGNHMHFKFNNTENAVALFSFKKFFKLFIKAYKERFKDNEKYMKRLKNSFCKAVYKESKIIRQLKSYEKNSSRYCAINLNAFNIHKTLEIRILPYFESYEEAKESITWLVKTVNEILNKNNCTIISENLNVAKVEDIDETVEIEKIKKIF